MKISQFDEIILASASPRRKQLLESLGFSVRIQPSSIVEKRRPDESIKNYVLRNAKEKSMAIGKSVVGHNFIISADTVVVTNENELLEKPLNAPEAYEMLSKLSNNTHLVYTAYVIAQKKNILIEKLIETKVTFRQLFDDEIYEYIATGEPFDKAGGYGIQGPAMGFIECIEGSYTSVMGLPLSHVVHDLQKIMMK